jgi:hypothetical protein
MKSAILAGLACAAVACAADPPQQQVKAPDAPSKQVKKLGTVTWHPDTHKLSWVVQKGTMVNGQFVSNSEERYEVSPEDAFMAYGEEHRGIDSDEAVSLHRLLDTLALYCAQSTVWWDQGQGVRLPKGGKPSETKQPSQPPRTEPTTDPKPTRVAERAAAKGH